MRTIIFILFVLLLQQTCFAQNDTVYHYTTSKGTDATKDNYYACMKITPKGNLWHGLEVFANGKTRSEGDYTDAAATMPTGDFKNYTEDGKLQQTASYDSKSLPVLKTYYYKSGNRQSYVKYNGNEIAEQKGFDESGNEIKNYVVEKEASFKDGINGWIKYLQKNINTKTAIEAGMPVGEYKVMVTFTVSKDGSVKDVKAEAPVSSCKPCTAEVINVISSSPDWKPAIVNNEPANAYRRQPITFTVEEGKKKKG